MMKTNKDKIDEAVRGAEYLMSLLKQLDNNDYCYDRDIMDLADLVGHLQCRKANYKEVDDELR